MSGSEQVSLDLAAYICAGDRLVWSGGTAEPLTLTEALVAQRTRIGPVSAFIGTVFSQTLRPEHADLIQLTGLGGIGLARALTAHGAVQVLPCNFSELPQLLEHGQIGCDVAMPQLSPAGPDGLHSFGLATDYIVAAVKVARTIVAEINDQIPWTEGGHSLHASRIDHAVRTSRQPLQVPSTAATPEDEAIARHAALHIPDGAVLQVGVGRLPDAVLRLLADRRDLGIHSGLISDALLDLIMGGAVTNARKREDAGISVAGSLFGTDRLYRFAHRNKAVALRTADHTHDAAVLARIERFISINSALEVDLSGQVNAEGTGESYIGGVGGQPDFVRGAHRSPGGSALIILPSTARTGASSRITSHLTGPVTTGRSDVDIIVTEFGSAELRGQPIAERARRLIRIAHPGHRETLEREAMNIARRGF